MSSGPCSGVFLLRHVHGISSGVPLFRLCLLFFILGLAFPCDYGCLDLHQYAGLGFFASLHWPRCSLVAHRLPFVSCFACLWIAPLFRFGLVISAGVRPRAVSYLAVILDRHVWDSHWMLSQHSGICICCSCFPSGDDQFDDVFFSTQ